MKGMLLFSGLLLLPQSSTATLWPASSVPAVVDVNDPGPVELGVKFRSDVDGSVTGLRFYKSAANSGTHVGNLWTSTGANLAHVTFAGETTSGWQQMNFATPVSITANTVYVASYYCPAGHYSANQNYFGTALDNAPLHAPADGGSGGNGVFVYGPASAYPNQTYLASNYWVDVVFSPAASTPTPTPTPPSSTAPASSGPRGADTGSNDHCGCGSAGHPGALLFGAALLATVLVLARRPA